mgnify:CR=1 FL=1
MRQRRGQPTVRILTTTEAVALLEQKDAIMINWAGLSSELRTEACHAFWECDFFPEDQALALRDIALARGFRLQSIHKKSIDQRVRLLMIQRDLTDTVQESILRSLYLGPHKTLLTTLLDELGVPHEDGMLPDDMSDISAPSLDAAKVALAKLSAESGDELVRVLFQVLSDDGPAFYVNLKAVL